MSNDEPLWVRFSFQGRGDKVLVSAEGTGQPLTVPREMSVDADSLDKLSAAVGKAAQAQPPKPVDEDTRAELGRLFREVFAEAPRDICSELRRKAGASGPPVLLQIAAQDGDLQAVPWEAMLAPEGGALGISAFLAGSTAFHVVREVVGGEPPRMLRMPGKVRVLVIAAVATGAVTELKARFADAEAKGQIELDILTAPEVRSFDDLQEALKKRKSEKIPPHIVHLVAHGAVKADQAGHERPVLQLGDGDEAVDLPAQSLADELTANFSESLRLLVLDACHSAAPSASGNAAEILARGAAIAVVAHLWPLDIEIAKRAAKSFYGTLTLGAGDVAESVNAARRMLLAESAAAFSMVLYLRGRRTQLFDFSVRPRLEVVANRKANAEIPRPLKKVLAERCSLLLGNLAEDPVGWQEALRAEIAGQLGVPLKEVQSIDEALQRMALVMRRDGLARIFEDTLRGLLLNAKRAFSPLVWSASGVLYPGVHATLMRMPFLELALAERHPNRTIYVVQPPLEGQVRLGLRVWCRKANTEPWELARPTWAKERDVNNDFVVLRLFGGYLSENDSRVDVLLTEDDHAQVRQVDMPKEFAPVLREFRDYPALFVGISVLDWRHRAAMRRAFDSSMTPGSVAVLGEAVGELEERIWTEGGGGLASTGPSNVEVVRRDLDMLVCDLNDCAWRPQ